MVGACLACALADSALRIALVERTTLDQLRPGDTPDIRVSAISQASRNILDSVGVWGQVGASGATAFCGMEVWDSAGRGCIRFDCADIGARELGWIAENRVIQYRLLERASASENIDLLTPASLVRAEWRDVAVAVELDNGACLRTRLLVGADGARSRVRKLAGIDTFGWAYQQTAVVATVATGIAHQGVARQCFLPAGPLAFLPLAGTHSSIVWSTDPAHADRLQRMPEAEFETELAESFEHRLGNISLVSRRVGFPLRLQHARDYVRARAALVGDAAHTVHPLAGQGVNLGLQDAAALAEVLLDTLARGRDIGALSALRRYERWRKGHNLLVQGVMEGFKRLFGSRLEPLRLARNLGLEMTNALQPAKDLIMRQAMGLEGDLPRRARPAVATGVEAD